MKYFSLFLVSILLVGAGCASQTSQAPIPKVAPAAVPATPTPVNTETVKVTLVARRWSLTPSMIRVKKGDRVQLQAVSIDGTHGFSIPVFGVSMNLVQGVPQTAEFTADQAGTFPFSCNVFCGEGHGAMTGILIVE